MSHRLSKSRCTRCGGTQRVDDDPFTGGYSLTCWACGNTQWLDGDGAPYQPIPVSAADPSRRRNPNHYRPRDDQPTVRPLTDREREVLTLYAAGLRRADIAERLGVAPTSVGTHLEHVREKSGHGDRAALTRYAHALGLPEPS